MFGDEDMQIWTSGYACLDMRICMFGDENMHVWK